MLATDRQTAALVKLFAGGSQLSYKKGEYIIRPGQTPPGVFYIKSGIVKAFDISKYGEENLLIIRKEHEIFPLIWGITGNERQIIYETLSPTILLQISRDQFVEFLSAHTDALPPLLDIVVEMYRLQSERLLNLEYRSVRERLVSFLLTMEQRFSKKVEDGVLITVPLRHQDIASSIKATRETTSREMSYLERHNLVTSRQSLIVLKDIPKLRTFIG